MAHGPDVVSIRRRRYVADEWRLIDSLDSVGAPSSHVCSSLSRDAADPGRLPGRACRGRDGLPLACRGNRVRAREPHARGGGTYRRRSGDRSRFRQPTTADHRSRSAARPRAREVFGFRRSTVRRRRMGSAPRGHGRSGPGVRVDRRARVPPDHAGPDHRRDQDAHRRSWRDRATTRLVRAVGSRPRRVLRLAPGEGAQLARRAGHARDRAIDHREPRRIPHVVSCSSAGNASGGSWRRHRDPCPRHRAHRSAESPSRLAPTQPFGWASIDPAVPGLCRCGASTRAEAGRGWVGQPR